MSCSRSDSRADVWPENKKTKRTKKMRMFTRLASKVFSMNVNSNSYRQVSACDYLNAGSIMVLTRVSGLDEKKNLPSSR
jgi:hypothetical protein